MDYNALSKEELYRENLSLQQEITWLRQAQNISDSLSTVILNRKRTEQNFKKINEVLLSLGTTFDENIHLLTNLCGDLTGAAFTRYIRLEEGNPDVINMDANKVFIINDLQNSPLAQSDPNISAYKLNTYIGKPVVCDGQLTGSIYAGYLTPQELTIEVEQVFIIIASALGNEESRRKAQKQLFESEERFRSAFRTSPDSININRLADGLYIDINEGFTELTGYTTDDVSGKTSIELNIWDNPDDRARLVSGLRQNGHVENLEAVFRLKDGGTKTALMSARVFYIKGVPHILSVTRDMTDRKKAEIAIHESEQKFRSVVENAFDGIYLISDNRFTYANQRFCEIMGYSAEEIASEDFNFNITLTDRSRGLIEERRQARLREESIPGIYEFEIMTKSGELKEVEVSTVKLETQGELMVLGIMRDITDRRKLFEELLLAKDKAEEVNILKSRLLANLSHEIRTPLNGILGFAELLREDIKDASQRSMADIIYSSGYRLLNTLNSILDLSVIESQFSKMNLKRVSLNSLAREVVVLFKPNTLKKGIGLNISTDQENIMVNADEELITKILNNLINNAIKFTDAGGITVTLFLEKIGNHEFGCIRVTDTGIGIKEEFQKIIFEEFRQVSEGQNRNYDGSGLGLHISKRFAEMMGGTITVQSELGTGSTFTLSLPVN